MRSRWALVLCLLLFSIPAFAQTGSVTGFVTDASGAVLPGVAIVATNSNTGANYETISTETGNYVLTAMPSGAYELAAELPGFRRYVRRGITIIVAQTLRIDIGLDVGAATDEVTITADAPLLRTESSDVSTVVNAQRLNELPILGIGQGAVGTSGVRNPWTLMTLVPGVNFKTQNLVQINGMPGNTERIRIEGQDGSSNLNPAEKGWNQPSPDEIQEVTVLTSNFAAEFGSTGGGLINVTMKGGTNQFHGTVYDYFVNEFLNAGTPYLPLDSKGRNPRSRNRRQDFGGNLGGPLMIPGLYEGRNRTFFFVNFEQFREKRRINDVLFTVPTPAYRNGDFSGLLTGRQLGTDPLGRPIMEGTIYDIATERVVNGQVVRDPFPDNKIPLNRMDPIALRIQSFIPQPTLPGRASNFLADYPNVRTTPIWSFKIDHNLNSNHKLSFYLSRFSSYAEWGSGGDGMPPEVSSVQSSNPSGHTERLNYDWTISPTLLLHVGLGYQNTTMWALSRTWNPKSEEGQKRNGFDALATFGLPGQVAKLVVPAQQGLSTANGGMKNMGSNQQHHQLMQKPTAIVSLTWVKNNHSYKFGVEGRHDRETLRFWVPSSGRYNYSADQTGLGRLQNIGGGFVGFPYASFLLGLVDNASVGYPTDPRTERFVTALYAQDTWKVTPNFTLDYGLRWDYSGYPTERFDRVPNFSATTINPKTGTLGAVVFEGEGQGGCECDFAERYWYGFGPRLGAAWQVLPKTVVRGGLGVAYTQAVVDQRTHIYYDYALGISIFNSPSIGQPAFLLKNGVPAPQPWPTYDAGLFPTPGSLNFGAVAIDPQGGRPARRVEWTLAVQRELSANMAVEVAYVGNRGVWWEANAMRNLNANTPERLASFGLDVTNPADFSLLRQRIDSSAAIARGFGPNSRFMPYATFPTGSTVAQMLRPFPQFSTLPSLWTPQGKNWYDGLQVKFTKRLSYGLDVSSSFAWQKELQLGTNAVNNVFDYKSNKSITATSRPLSLIFAGNYEVPALNIHRVLSTALRDWQIGAVLQYASGEAILAPAAQTQLGTVLFSGNSYANRVPGEPLFTVDMNCHCFDPLKTFVLNPKAWTDPPQGQYGTGSPYYSDYRYQRRPSESMSLSRVFGIRENMEFIIRAEFANVFNRRPTGNPTTTNARQTQTVDPQTGNTLAGFGRIGPEISTTGSGGFSTGRSGTIVARLRF